MCTLRYNMNIMYQPLLYATYLLFIHEIRVQVVRKIVQFRYQSVFVNDQLNHLCLIIIVNYNYYNSIFILSKVVQ